MSHPDIVTLGIDITKCPNYDLLFIPNSTARLISISCLAYNSNAQLSFYNTSCAIYNKFTRALLATGTLFPSNLYSLNLYQPKVEHTFVAPQYVSMETWHCCLGHANYHTLHTMAHEGLVAGMSVPQNTPAKCDSCIISKQTCKPVPKQCKTGKGHRATKRLEKVFVDLAGPQSTRSHMGNEYIMDLIDDYSREMWSIPIIQDKKVAFERLKAWKQAHKLEPRLKIGVYIVDWGELNSNKMRAWLGHRVHSSG